MNEMDNMRNNRDYDNRNYRDDYRYYDDAFYGNYRDDYRRGYDGRDRRRNYRYNRDYREDGFHEELEMVMEDMREGYRKLEDIGEMAHNQQDKNVIIRVAQKEKENYMALKQITEKQI